jgi:hypothetical protein
LLCIDFVPVIHPGEHRVRLMYHEHRRFHHRVEIRIGHHHGDFQNPVDRRIKPAHLHVDPDQAVRVLCHNVIRIVEVDIVSQFSGPRLITDQPFRPHLITG